MHGNICSIWLCCFPLLEIAYCCSILGCTRSSSWVSYALSGFAINILLYCTRNLFRICSFRICRIFSKAVYKLGSSFSPFSHPSSQDRRPPMLQKCYREKWRSILTPFISKRLASHNSSLYAFTFLPANQPANGSTQYCAQYTFYHLETKGNALHLRRPSSRAASI